MLSSIIEFLSEDSARVKLPLHKQIVAILARYSQKYGEGTTFQEALKILVEQSQNIKLFILNNSSKTKLATSNGASIDLYKTQFYEWLGDSNSDKLSLFDNVTITMEDVIAGFPNYPERAGDENEGNFNTEKIDSDQAPASAKVRAVKGEYISPQRPAGSPPPVTFPEIALAVIFHMVATSRDRKTLANLSISSINGPIYQDFSIKRPESASRLVLHYAGDIYAGLPPNFRSALIGSELAHHAANPPSGRIKCRDPKHEAAANDQFRQVVRGELLLKQRGGGRGGGIGGVVGGGRGVGGREEKVEEGGEEQGGEEDEDDVDEDEDKDEEDGGPAPLVYPFSRAGLIHESELRPRIRMSNMYGPRF